jgi:hypothetical protein
VALDLAGSRDIVQDGRVLWFHGSRPRQAYLAASIDIFALHPPA